MAISIAATSPTPVSISVKYTDGRRGIDEEEEEEEEAEGQEDEGEETRGWKEGGEKEEGKEGDEEDGFIDKEEGKDEGG